MKEQRGRKVTADVFITGGDVVVTGSVDATIDGYSAITASSATVTTAGARVQFSAVSVPCQLVKVSNPITNSGILYIGGSTISSTNGVELLPGDKEDFPVDNLNDLWADASMSGSLVKFNYFI